VTPEQQKNAQQFVDMLPHCRALNMRIEGAGPSRAVMSFPYNEKLVGDPETGVIHGGAVSVLMDTCGGAAVMAHPENGGSFATLDLRIDYMRSAHPGRTVYAEAECFHVTRTVAFVRVTAWDDDRAEPVATASATFTFTPRGAAEGTDE
jgi:uncharacterized protein (TIGR00369 family)